MKMPAMNPVPKPPQVKPFPKYTDVSEASRIYILPNSLTAGNLFFGFLAIIRCIQARYVAETQILSTEYYTQAVWCILIACIFDALDGRVARMGGKESLFGKEFDSIADTVSFGMAPALMVFFMILSPTDKYPFFRQIGWLISFVYLLCASIRLARFNVLTHPSVQESQPSDNQNFLGLPVPTAAGMIASLVLFMNEYALRGFALCLPIFMLLIAWLMVSSIEYPSFKEVGWSTRMNIRLFIVLFASLPVFFWYHEVSFMCLFLGYIGFGLGRHAWRWMQQRKAA